jgi:dTDP-4-dehydrorhamnose reductase
VTVLVTGAGGQLGRALLRVLGDAAIPLTHADLDIGDAGAVRQAVRAAQPDAIVNAAAWTDVDACEGDPERAQRVNALGAGHVAEAGAEAGAFVVQVSTDYVFDGTIGRAYVEDDAPNPISVYGRTKLEGEDRVRAAGNSWAIARTAWLYGRGGRNFVRGVLEAASEGRALEVVDDQVGSPTAAGDLAAAIAALVDRRKVGIFHVVNAGACSRYVFARAILEAAGRQNHAIRPVKTSPNERPARRPAYAPLEGTAWRAAGFSDLRSWHAALEETLPEIAGDLG